ERHCLLRCCRFIFHALDGATTTIASCSLQPSHSVECSGHETGLDEVAKEVALFVVHEYDLNSSGKTHTMRGITEYAMADIFGYTYRKRVCIEILRH
ncbi:unnamed protein product, partial [Linum tenue]